MKRAKEFISLIFLMGLCSIVYLSCIEANAEYWSITGIDIGGTNASEFQKQAEYDYLGLCCEAGLKTVGQEFVSWNAIEPAPPDQGVHSYDWSKLDQDVTEIEAVGGRFTPTLIPDAAWAVEATQAHSSPPKDEAACALANPDMGMSCWEAWRYFVSAVVERYDNDNTDDMPGLQSSHLYYQIGTEYENVEQWDTASGTQRVEKYAALLQAAYEAAKQANLEAKIISFSFSFGDGFDDNPTLEDFNSNPHPIVVPRREFVAQVFQQAEAYFDIVGTNVNFHYNGIPARVRWIRSYTDKPIWFVDAATAYLLDRHYLQLPLYDGSIYPYKTETEIGEILVFRDDPEHATIKAWWESEKAKYAMKKAMIAASQQVENIGFQFMFDTMGSNNLWGTIAEMAFNIACGVLEYGFDYEPMGTAKPVYYTIKLFNEKMSYLDSVTDLNPLPEGVDPTGWTWKVKFTRANQDIFALWSEGGAQTLDLSSYFSNANVRVMHIVTSLDQNNEPVYPADEIVPVNAVPINETPIFVQETGSFHHVDNCTVCHFRQCGDCSNAMSVNCEIATPNSGDKDVIFTATTGGNSYADGDSVYNGICEVCHTQTTYHRNNTSGDHAHYVGENCISCHKHSDEFNNK